MPPPQPQIPHLPSGWSAQWDSDTNRYYYVQMANGLPQWEVPTQPAPTTPPDDTHPAFKTSAGRSEQTAEERSQTGKSAMMDFLSGGKSSHNQSGRGGMGGR